MTLDPHGVGPKKTIVGILGGMGPAATVDFVSKIVARTPIGVERDHLPLAIWSNPEIPDRTLALLGTGPSPVPAMADGVLRLLGMGAETIAIPCNTAHAFLDELRAQTGADFLDMIASTVAALIAADPATRRVGILATAGTRLSGLYAHECRRQGIEAVDVSALSQQRLVDTAISDVKLGTQLPEAALRIREAAEELVGLGATVAIAGCSEIPLVAQGAATVLPIIDATDCLAAAVIDRVRTGVCSK